MSVLLGTMVSLQYLMSSDISSFSPNTRSLDIKLMSCTRMCSL